MIENIIDTSNTTQETTIEQASIDNAATDTAEETSIVYLPDDYLANGYYATTDTGIKYLRPEFVGKYAEIMAALLADMKPSDFNGLIREMKRCKKSNQPFEVCFTVAVELIPKSLQLIHRHKAPALLVTFIKHNIDNIHEDMNDWMAFYRHLEAVAAFMEI